MEVEKNAPEVVVPPTTYTLTLTEDEANVLFTFFAKSLVNSENVLLVDNPCKDFTWQIYRAFELAGAKLLAVYPNMNVRVVDNRVY